VPSDKQVRGDLARRGVEELHARPEDDAADHRPGDAPANRLGSCQAGTLRWGSSLCLCGRFLHAHGVFLGSAFYLRTTLLTWCDCPPEQAVSVQESAGQPDRSRGGAHGQGGAAAGTAGRRHAPGRPTRPLAARADPGADSPWNWPISSPTAVSSGVTSARAASSSCRCRLLLRPRRSGSSCARVFPSGMIASRARALRVSRGLPGLRCPASATAERP
jgi:hypothetical protein